MVDARRSTSSLPYSFCLSMARRMPMPNSALSSNSEFDHAGPRPSEFTRVRRGRQVAAVDRRAAGGIRDQCAVAEQLRHHLDVRSFAATGAGAGELEQRLQQLRVLHLAVRELLARQLRDGQEVVPVLVVLLAQRRLRLHVDGAVLGFALALGRAHRDAQSAAGAIFRRDLQGVLQLGEFAPLGNRSLEALGRMIDDWRRRRPWRE